MSTRIRIWQVDAFADRPFRGNPAAVCPLDGWLPDAVLQAIAAENNLSETAFFVAEGDGFRLRWFTPRVEVPLCGHATLASAWVLFHQLEPRREAVTFQTLSGPLTVRREGALLAMDLPARPPEPCVAPADLATALGSPPREILAAADKYLCIYDAEAAVRDARPELGLLARLERPGVIISAPAAPGRGVDFVSRYFAPAKGVPEDPVTGAAHCTLVPYWAARLGRERLVAEQLSARGGRLDCRLLGARVRLAGACAPFLSGEIELAA